MVYSFSLFAHVDKSRYRVPVSHVWNIIPTLDHLEYFDHVKLCAKTTESRINAMKPLATDLLIICRGITIAVALLSVH